jgi:putative hydrolase of the HAD superfamily
VIRGVVFDLWNTLASWRENESNDFRRRWTERIGVTPEAFDEVWHAPGAYERRESGPIADALTSTLAALGVEDDVSEVVDWRVDIARRALVPDPDVIPTLEEIRRRGLATGLVSNSTEEVALVWTDTPLAALFDVAVFSATAGWLKPDARIYEAVLAGLGLDAAECLFVGDGQNDELAGAERLGMTPVLLETSSDGFESWEGLRISAIPQVLELLE